MKKILLLFAMFTLLASCDTKKMTNVLVYRAPISETVEVKGVGESIPENATFLGSVSVGEKGATKTRNCTYQAVINDAMHLTRTMGGNLMVITEHKEPHTYGSTCHQIAANVYYVDRNSPKPATNEIKSQSPNQSTATISQTQPGIIYHGRMLSCRLISSISSVYPPGATNMIVDEDFKDPDGKVLVAKGTPVKASFTTIQAKGIRPGQITLTVQSTESVDGQTILLTGSQTVTGEKRASHYNASMPVNTIINVFIQGSYEVR